MKKNGPLVLFFVNGLVALVLGFFAATPAARVEWVRGAGCWLILIAFVAFAVALGRVVWRCPHAWIRDRREWLGLLSVPAGCAMLLPHEPRGFKVIMDEIMLLGTSMSMHFNRLVEAPVRGNDLSGAFQIVEGAVDKRPIFFPFLVSLVHDARGYRPDNAFVLNAVLTLVLLAAIYVLARTLAGRWAAAASVLLLGGLPLLAQNAVGGGFELLNLTMIAVTLWLALRTAETRDRVELTALLLAAVLLAQTRSESVLFLVPCGLLVLWVWWRERRVVFSWTAAWVPLLLLPVPWIFAVYTRQPASWETASRPGSGAPVAFSHVAANLGHARAFFFATTGAQSNSILFSSLGILAVGGFLGWAVHAVCRRRVIPANQGVVAVFAGALLAHFVCIMTYFSGQLDEPLASRYSLPTHLLFLAALWLVVSLTRASHRVWMVIAALALLQFWRLSVPAMANNGYAVQNVYAREVEWRRTFIAEHPEKDFLVVDPYTAVWLTHLVSSTPPGQARAHSDVLAFHLRVRSFRDIFVFQRFEIDPTTGRRTVVPEFDVGREFILEPVAERRLQPYTVTRMSRLVAVKPAEADTAPAGKSTPR